MRMQSFRPIWATFMVMTWSVLCRGDLISEKCQPVKHERGMNIFNCSGIDINELPDDLPVEAEILDFSRNQFTDFPAIPESSECHDFGCAVVNSTNHCRVAISFQSNNIDRFEDFALSKLRCLRQLDVSDNDITADIFNTEFFEEGAYYLEHLILRGNPLGRLPDNVITHPFLQALKNLDVSDCELTELGRNSVDDFAHMLKLNLSHNLLTDVHPDTFKGLRDLQELDLTHNQLTTFTEHVFGDLKSLQHLRLSSNKIKDIHSRAFYKDSGLQELHLDDNLLESIPYAALENLPKLHKLDLSRNPIKKLTHSAYTSNVETLILDEMPALKEIKPHELTSFTNLEKISVSNCQAMSKIHSFALDKSFSQLRHVRLANNWLTTLASDALPWQQLDTLELDGNPWICDQSLKWMIEAKSIKGPVICAAPDHLKGKDLKFLSHTQLKREVPVAPTAAIIIFLLAIPLVVACAVFVYRRRRFCACTKRELRGRYITVFSRDVEDQLGDRADIRIKENSSHIMTVSNGGADDTRHLVKIEQNGSTVAADDEEEEI